MSEGPKICAACKQPIEGDVLTAFNMTWHPHHLGCKICQKDFSDGSPCFEGPDGFAYCEADYNERFNASCAACGQPIENELRVDAMGKAWHQHCFKCPMCPMPFETLSFVPGDDGFPYCETHFYEKRGLLCAACRLPILQGKRVTMGDKAFHADHFCCAECKKHLAGLTFRRKEDKPYCVHCFQKLFG